MSRNSQEIANELIARKTFWSIVHRTFAERKNKRDAMEPPPCVVRRIRDLFRLWELAPLLDHCVRRDVKPNGSNVLTSDLRPCNRFPLLFRVRDLKFCQRGGKRRFLGSKEPPFSPRANAQVENYVCLTVRTGGQKKVRCRRFHRGV